MVVATGRDVIVGKCYIEWVELWCEAFRPETGTFGWVVDATKIHLPIGIPRACDVRCRVALAGFLAHPEYGGGNTPAPAVALMFPCIKLLDHNSNLE